MRSVGVKVKEQRGRQNKRIERFAVINLKRKTKDEEQQA
jgi:hypothetical protein